jgi:hypothetical protein
MEASFIGCTIFSTLKAMENTEKMAAMSWRHRESVHAQASADAKKGIVAV